MDRIQPDPAHRVPALVTRLRAEGLGAAPVARVDGERLPARLAESHDLGAVVSRTRR
jgi:hypothetical protein